MPLFYQHNINEFSRLGIWKIEEPADFFSYTVPLQREISHPHKRLQHLAGRYLLQYLFSDFPYELIEIADTRKPFLSNEAYHFSISHCGNYAAAIVSRTSRVGIDIELVKPMIQKIRYKFIGEQEMQILSGTHPGSDEIHGQPRVGMISSTLLTLGWSSKEAIFKWFGNGGIDFKNHMQLASEINFENDDFIESSYIFSKIERVILNVSSKFFGELVMSFLIS